MNVQESLARYHHFHSDLMKLGNFPLNEKPTMKELELSSGFIQVAYKLIRELNFKDNLIEFMCLMSLQFVQYNWLLGLSIITERKTGRLVAFKNEEEKLSFCLKELVETCLRLKTDAKNMLRLNFNSGKFHYFFESADYQEFRSKFPKYNEADLNALCVRVISSMYSHSFNCDDLAIADSVREELKSLSKQKLSSSKEIAVKKILLLLPRERTVLRGIVQYLNAVGGDQISSIERVLVKHFSMQKVKISHATIYNAVQGLTKVGLLKILAAKKWRAFVFEFNRELYAEYEDASLKI